MASLTGSQKKNRNKFIALLVAILVVAAAIFYVVYSAFMAKSAYLENQDFATALATAFDKAERKVSKEDLAAVKFVELSNDGESGTIFIGYDDFVSQYNKYMDEYDAVVAAEEAGEENIPEITTEFPIALTKNGAFETGTEFTTLKDLGYFSGAEILSVSNVDLDAETLAKFPALKEGTFSYCNITNEELAALAGAIDLANVEELTFMGNGIDDWSPVESISDKVVIMDYTYTITEDGQLQPIQSEQTLTEYLAAKAEAEAEAESEETAEEASEEAVVEETAEEVIGGADEETDIVVTDEAATEEAVTETVETTEEAVEEATEETVSEAVVETTEVTE